MKQTRLLMNMPVVVEVLDEAVIKKDLADVFSYFMYIDEVFSPFKPESLVSKMNRNQLRQKEQTTDFKKVFELCEQTKQETDGYFDAYHSGVFDPSGIVKGWAIHNVAEQLHAKGFQNFSVEVGGDIQTSGQNEKKKKWRVGIRNPFNVQQLVKVVHLENNGIATSGTYERGQHIYNPKRTQQNLDEIVSLTVVGPNIYEADRFATAAFAMQRQGIHFIEKLPRLEAYMIDKNGIGTMTTGFDTLVEGK
jgi:FAD:protein FMN transferase